ncbi:MAG: OmpH family outer membrane protein [Paludibacteraceae bacterium]|nr:OmpH family outer membrane protein [Paludibacteraceae bacterium]
MKKMILMLALVLPMIASAQKLGHINSQELLAAMPELKTVQAKLDTLAGQYEAQFANMQEEFNTKLAKFQQEQATMTAGVREFRQQEIAEMEQRIYLFRQTAQEDLQKKQQEFMAPIQQRMMDAIKKVSQAQGCTYVFEAMTLHYIAPDALDLMPLVKKELGIQ